MEDFTYCTVCLGMNVKMFQMNSLLFRTYSELISIKDTSSLRQMYACYECTYLLHKYGEFKEKCCKAYNVLLSATAGSFKVTEEILKCIDRKKHNLESKLVIECITTKYHIIEPQNEHQDPNNKFNDEEVKIESLIDNRREKTRHNSSFQVTAEKHNHVVISSFHNVLINDDQTPYSGEKMKTEVFVDNIQNDIDNNFQSIDVLETESAEFNDVNATNINIGEIKTELELENSKTGNIKNDQEYFGSDSASDIDSDSDSVELNEILARYSVKNSSTDKKQYNTKPKKRKLESANEKNTLLNKDSKKLKIGKKTLNETAKNSKLLSGSGKKNISLKLLQSKKIKSLKFLEKKKAEKKGSYSFDPSVYKDYATIVELTPEDARHEVLLRKESLNYMRCVYKCELCYRGFNMQATFQTHMNKHSLEHGSHECDICQLRFFAKKDLRSHLLNRHTRKFICKLCPYISYGSTQAKNHMCLHKGKEYICKDCGEKFRYPNSLLTHQRIKHNVELVCDLCGNTFGSAKGLKVHKNLLHKRGS